MIATILVVMTRDGGDCHSDHNNDSYGNSVVLVMMVTTIVMVVFVLEEPRSCHSMECSTEYLMVRFSSPGKWLLRVNSPSTSVFFYYHMSLVQK